MKTYINFDRSIEEVKISEDRWAYVSAFALLSLVATTFVGLFFLFRLA